MDRITSEDREDLSIDLESGRMTREDSTNQSLVLGNRQSKSLLKHVASGLLGFKGSVGVEYSYSNLGEPSKVAADNVQVLISNNSGGEESEEHMALVEKKHLKGKHKKPNYKKAPKPPRPPKGPSLDAADLKLVKEISTINMKKRARTERLKASRKMKESKLLPPSLSSSSSPSSSSSSSFSSSSSLFAMVITVLFFLVILYQGLFSGSSSSVSFQGSPAPALATNSLISVEFYNNPSSSIEGSGLGS